MTNASPSPAAEIGAAINKLESTALDNGYAVRQIQGRRVAAIAHSQTRDGRTVRRVCWELEGAGISRANLLAALNRRAATC